MSISFLGGASSIGASCVLVELDGLCAVVDCGIRQARGETLPDLSTLQTRLDGRTPDAIVLTHAHLDHSGALPVLHTAFPATPVITSHATAGLLRVLLLDALKIMDTDRDEELPLYARHQVEGLLAALRTVSFDDPVPVGSGTVRLLPAGHILGAGAALLEARHRSVLVSGDLSIADQRTVPGMPVPRVRPDALVVESTYGTRLHASREVEERRLCARVAAAIEAGGHVLIPAFAVGRAQEVLLSLRAAMDHGTIPAFPVLADGMVRAVCRVYRQHPAFLARKLRRRVQRGRDPFAGDGLDMIRSAAHRQEVQRGPPCCVVASSGMLAGGASPTYARAWADDPRSLIAITGYQDEEAPGRALLQLADGETRTLRLPGGSVEVACQVERYQLSAHADCDELVGLVRKLEPQLVLPVHGDAAAREALAARLEPVLRGAVRIPETGDTVGLRAPAPRRRSTTWAGPGIGGGRPLDASGLAEVRDLLLRGDERPRQVTAEQIAAVWYGEDPGPEALAGVRAALEGDASAFAPDPRLAFRYRPVTPEPERTGPAPLAELLAEVDRLLPAASGLYKRSAHQEQHRLVLSFAFPDTQGAAAAPILDELRASTGWQLQVHPHPHQARLAEAARAALPGALEICRGPSFHPHGREVRLTVAGTEAADVEGFAARTGWRLALQRVERARDTPVVAPAPAATVLGPQEGRTVVEQVFADISPAERPLKIGWPGTALVLHFAHPAMARRHEGRIAALAAETGRTVRIHPHPNHQRLAELAATEIPEGWTTTGAIGYVPQRDALRVKVWSLPPLEQQRTVSAAVEARTGCRLEVVPDTD